jgi:hypothetical protein
VVVCDIGVGKPKIFDALQLMVHQAEWVNERKASDIHVQPLLAVIRPA